MVHALILLGKGCQNSYGGFQDFQQGKCLNPVNNGAPASLGSSAGEL